VDVPHLPGNAGGLADVGTNALTGGTAEDQSHTHLGEMDSHPTVQRGSEVDLVGSVIGVNDGNSEEVLFNMFGRYLEVSLAIWSSGECLEVDG